MLIFGILTVLTASGVVFSQKPLHSALFLVLTLFLVAAHFALLGAHFMAAIQIIVYAGAIMVLVIFVIMLLGVEADGKIQPKKAPFFAQVIFISFFLGLLVAVVHTGLKFPVAEYIRSGEAAPLGNTEAIGQLLFSNYLFPFEVTSLLLLAAIMGAVMLALEKKRPLGSGRGLRSKQGLRR